MSESSARRAGDEAQTYGLSLDVPLKTEKYHDMRSSLKRFCLAIEMEGLSRSSGRTRSPRVAKAAPRCQFALCAGRS